MMAQGRLDKARGARRPLEIALDHLADGVILIGRGGAIVFANRAAREIARHGDGIDMRHGKLELASADARVRFDIALAEARRPRGALAAGAHDFPVARSDGATPYLMSVRPLGDGKREHPAYGAAAAIVFLHDPRGRAAAAVGVLCEVFGLTEAEGALAQALQTGVSLAEYTEARALSLNTVYTHLRRLREKTGCSRMPELIAKLYNLRMPLRLE